MSDDPFVNYASSGNLGTDETYTVELLIEEVCSQFEEEKVDAA